MSLSTTPVCQKRCNPSKPTLLSVLVAAAFAQVAPAVAAEPALDTIVVTATRFENSLSEVPASMSVISGDAIRANPAISVPDLLRSVAGVQVRALSGSMATDASIDIRGMGEATGGNILILLDGQRLNEVDSASINWAMLPREAIDRIEVLRGAGTVLYGDRAVGGVVNIITRHGGDLPATITAGVGSFGQRLLSVSGGAHNEQGLYLRGGAQFQQETGYRKNSEADVRNVNTRLGWQSGKSLDVYVDTTGWSNTNGLPGAIFRPQYISDPTQTRKPNEYAENHGYIVRPGVHWQVSTALTFDAEAGQTKRYDAYRTPTFNSDRTHDTVSFTPRVRWQHGLGGLDSETVIGFDTYRGSINYTSSTPGHQTALQDSQSVYVNNTTFWTSNLSTTLGARHQRMQQSAADLLAPTAGNTTRERDAGEIGLQWQEKDWRIFARGGTVFRFANTDELFGLDSSFATIYSGDLRPQHGVQGEIGSEFSIGTARLGISIFNQHLKDEIAYDGNTFTNVNLPRTRRRGLELTATVALAPHWAAGASYTYTNAQFVEGANAGKRIPLVARQHASAHLNWQGGAYGTHGLNVLFVGSQPISGDFANAKVFLPGYTTLDWRSRYDWQNWNATFTVRNLTNKKYSEFGGYGGTPADYYYYPANGRGAYVTLGYTFK